MASIPATPPQRLAFDPANKRKSVPSKVREPRAADRFTACQITQPIPRGLGDEQYPDVERVHIALVNALRARGCRKAMRKPAATQPESYYSQRGRKTASAWHRSHRHLRRLAFRALNDLTGEGFAPPDADTLAEAFSRYADERLSHLYLTWDETKPSGFEKWAFMPECEVENLARFTARVVGEEWRPEWINAARLSGRKGGRKSRRGPAWTDTDLDRLTHLQGLTREKQAGELGFGIRTIARMRVALRERKRGSR